MSNLPQIHDWMFNLLTVNQWIFVWVVLGFIVLCLGVYGAVTLDEGWFFGLSVWVAVFGIPLLFTLLLGVGHFLSWLIYLLNT